MPDETARTRRPASQAGHLVPLVAPIPGAHAELFALDRALAQLSAAAIGMIAARLSSRGAATTGNGGRLSLAEVPAAAADLLAQGAGIVHAVTGRPDVLGLLTPGPLLRAVAESGAQIRILCQDVLRTDLGGQRAGRLAVLPGDAGRTHRGRPVKPDPAAIQAKGPTAISGDQA